MAIASGVAAVLAVTVSAQTFLSMRTHGHAFPRILAWQLATWIFWAIAAPFVLRTGASLSTGRRPRAQWASTLGLGVLLIGAHAIVTAQFTVWIQPFTPV